MLYKNMLELSQLHCLITVAKHGSFSRAAEELQITQSAISQSVKNLEERLGVRLFNRNGKNIVLTLEGQKLCVTSQKFLNTLEDTIQEIQDDKNKMVGGLRVGSLVGISKSWLLPDVMNFSEKYPDIFVNFKLSLVEDLLEKFEKSLLDCIIVPEDSVPLTGEKILFRDEYITLVFPKHSNYNISEGVDLTKISSYPLIFFENGDLLFSNWSRKLFGSVPSKVQRRIAVNSHGAMLSAVSRGLGIAVIPTHVLERSYYKDKVCTLGKNYEVFYQRYFLVYHKESRDLLRVKIFIDEMLATNGGGDGPSSSNQKQGGDIKELWDHDT
ncbi:MAG: LysR family transcriptional regulator [Oligoflexia bacterium]|nr:LysR family transcriptional regulator [Oligoflexia bacterium]